MLSHKSVALIPLRIWKTSVFGTNKKDRSLCPRLPLSNKGIELKPGERCEELGKRGKGEEESGRWGSAFHF